MAIVPQLRSIHNHSSSSWLRCGADDVCGAVDADEAQPQLLNREEKKPGSSSSVSYMYSSSLAPDTTGDAAVV